MKISLGPIQYYWPKDKVLHFYQLAADSNVDAVYLGETVCAKRQELRLKDYVHIAHQLRESGKEVALSTMTLLESPADLRELKKYCDNGEFSIEANDYAAVGILQKRHLPFTAGTALNVYNQESLQQLHKAGMQRWVVPTEMSRDQLKAILNHETTHALRDQLEVELFSLGHIPLAWSARCFTARSENRDKDDCQLCCINYPEGRKVTSQDGREIFVLNGIQTQSGSRYNLINALESMTNLVDIIRISPQTSDTFYWVKAFEQAIAGGAASQLTSNDCEGYWYNIPGIQQVETAN